MAASTTDFFTITGAANTKVKIESISIIGEATNNNIPDVILLKRSTANSGGTSTTPTAVVHSSSDGAASAVVRAYTANPTLGTLEGHIKNVDIFFSGTNTSPSQYFEFVFGDRASKAITLNSASEVLSFNLGGVTVAGASVNVDITWTEE